MKLRTVAMAAAVLSITTAVEGQQRELPLESLTVPVERLDTECALTSTGSEKADGRRVIFNTLAGLPIQSNPWRGSDAAVMAAIYERIAPASEVPDGPPLSRAQMASYRVRFADDLEEAYAAVYRTNGNDLVTVYAVRFKEMRILERLRSNRRSSVSVHFAGRTAFVAQGPAGKCLQVVTDHLRTLPVP